MTRQHWSKHGFRRTGASDAIANQPRPSFRNEILAASSIEDIEAPPALSSGHVDLRRGVARGSRSPRLDRSKWFWREGLVGAPVILQSRTISRSSSIHPGSYRLR